MKKVGIFGGTFDPPHFGHLIIGERVREECELESVMFVPLNIPPHTKKIPTPAKDRLAMTKLATKENKYFVVSESEIARNKTSYTIDTIKELKHLLPSTELYLIIGMDEAVEILSWKKVKELVKMVKFVIIKRPKVKENLHSILKESKIIDLEIGISSTEIRERVRKSKSIKYLVPEEVRRYIKEKKLYRK
jgi:nicotinate-nucleotide adenylyltransferase